MTWGKKSGQIKRMTKQNCRMTWGKKSGQIKRTIKQKMTGQNSKEGGNALEQGNMRWTPMEIIEFGGGEWGVGGGGCMVQSNLLDSRNDFGFKTKSSQ